MWYLSLPYLWFIAYLFVVLFSVFNSFHCFYVLFRKRKFSWNISKENSNFRSYLYILVHYGPAVILKRIFFANKWGVFITMRCLLGLFNVSAEIKMYRALCSRFGNGIARTYVVLTSLSSGMFISRFYFLYNAYRCLVFGIVCGFFLFQIIWNHVNYGTETELGFSFQCWS